MPHTFDANTTVGETLTVSSAAVGLAANTKLHAWSALLQVVSGGPIRWYADSRTPTNSTGFVCVEFGTIELKSTYELAQFKAIKDATGTDASIEIMVRK